MLEYINQIPEWLGAAICGGIGWFAHVLYSWWQKSHLPNQPDQRRYDHIIKNVNTRSLYYDAYAPFTDVQDEQDVYISLIPNEIIENLSISNGALQNNTLPSFINNKLKTKERALRESVSSLCDEVSKVVEYHHGRSVYEVPEKVTSKQLEDLSKKISETIAAYEHFRDFGNQVFAQKVK